MATDGQVLDPTSAIYAAMPRDVRPPGRTAVFDATTVAPLANLHRGSEVVIPLPGGEQVAGQVNLVEVSSNGVVRVGGSLTGVDRGSFSLGSAHGQIAGQILLPDKRLAYVVTTPNRGQLAMQETALGEVICERMPRPANEPVAAAPAGPQAAPPVLSSRPTATAVLYLDFDGETVTDPAWNSGNTIVAAPCTLSNAQITEVWNRVKEDYWPFDIDVTTNVNRYNSAPVGRRSRVIITPTDTADPGAGGVAYVNTFSRAGSASFSSNIPCWVFNTGVVSVAESVSHELGHTLGLHHDGRTSPAEEYYAGQGYGAVSWGPIMGAAYSQTIVQWSKGEYANANNQEDDVAIIAGSANGFGYVTDDAGDTRVAAAALGVAGTSINQTGCITSANDVDYYVFSVTTAKTITINADPATPSPDLDILLELQDSEGNALVTEDPDLSVAASFSCNVIAGTYYLKIQGAGQGDPLVDGYTNYGSIGYYALTGSIVNGTEPVAPSITSQPSGASVDAGTTAHLYVSASGSSPFSYRWMKDGVNLTDGGRISGATSAYLTITNTQGADTGDYTVVVRNAKGSATSNPATLTVILPPPPTFYSQPSSTTVVEGNSLWLSGYASGNGLITYQWYKNGQALTNETSTSFSRSSATSADAGVYQVTATNAGGTTWSQSATVTITAASMPTIVTQPLGQVLCLGQSCSLGVYATSNTVATYQWYRDGVAIAGATGAYYYIGSATAGDAGSYTVVVSTPAGSVTSDPALIVVSSDLPPRITSQPYFYGTVTLGGAVSMSLSAEGTAPLTYQWYHDGAPVAGATGSTISIGSVVAGDLGEYFVAVTNPGGTVTSQSVYLNLSAVTSPPGFYWLDGQAIDGVVYFLHPFPLKIGRFDLSTGSWLDPWPLTRTPTAFAFASDAIYVAYGTDVVRYDRNFANATVFATNSSSVGGIFVLGNYLVICGANGSYPYTVIASYDRRTGAKISEASLIYSLAQGYSCSPSTGRVFGRTVGTSPSDIEGLTVQPDGTLGAAYDSPYHGAFPDASRTMVLADDTHVTDNSGIVYNGADLTYAGSFGLRLDDVIADGSGGYCALSGMRVYSHDQKYRQIGSIQIGIVASRIWRHDNALYAFAQPTGLGALPAFQTIDLTSIHPAAVAPLVDAQRRRVSPQKMILDENGVLYVYSKVDRNIFRWSVSQRRYLPPIPLASSPNFLAYSPANRALYFEGNGTQLKRLGLDSGSLVETPFYSSPQRVTGLQTAGSYLLFADPSGPWATHYTVSPEGAMISMKDWNYYSRAYTWSAANSRMYFFRDDTSPNDLQYEAISPDGQISSAGETPYHGSVLTDLPIRVSPDGTVVLLGSGQLYDGIAMTYLGSLPIKAIDAAWTTGMLHILRFGSTGAEIQTWPTISYQLARSTSFPGRPLGLFALAGDRLLLVTTVGGYLNYWLLSAADLSVISHDNTADAEVPARPPYFDAAGYLAHNPDLQAAFGSLPDWADQTWKHYWLYGLNEGRTDGDFDPAAYLAMYPDLQAAFGSDMRAAALQWYTTGRAEGRRIPAGFDARGYLARYPDLAAAFGNDLYGAWLHYLNYGVNEGRVFDTKFRVGEYPLLYGDLAALVGNPHGALLHWLNYGRAEGRMGRVPAGFDVPSYLSRYPDLAAVFGGLPYPQQWVAAWDHYVNYGINEGRTDGDFDPEAYLAMYGDLRAAFGDNWTLAAMHWYKYGRYEGRRIPAGFDARGYLARYPDVQLDQGDDLYGAWLHYLDWGVYEGRVYDEIFRPDEYLALYPDLRAAFGNDRQKALLHWLYYGQYEGRRGRFP